MLCFVCLLHHYGEVHFRITYHRLFEVVKTLIYILNFQKRFEHSQEFSLMHQSKCLNTQRSLPVVAALFVSVFWYCDMHTGVIAVKWYWARRYLSVNWMYQYPSRKRHRYQYPDRKMVPVQELY